MIIQKLSLHASSVTLLASLMSLAELREQAACSRVRLGHIIQSVTNFREILCYPRATGRFARLTL
jgi:hypothetical protein